MESAINEVELMKGIHEGTDAAFSYLFDRYFYAICAYMHKRITKDHPSIEDIAMEIFTSLFENRKKFEALIKVQAYLFVVAGNKCKKIIREQQRSLQQMEEYYYVTDKQQLPEEQDIVNMRSMTEISLYVDKLSDRCRQVFNLHYMKGLSIAEIARELKVTVGTVLQLQHRAKLKLRKVMDMEGSV